MDQLKIPANTDTGVDIKQEHASHKRKVRSFVRRTGRQSDKQKYAVEHYWGRYGLEYQADTLLDLAQLFAGLNRVKLEIGFGNGVSLVDMARLDDSCGYIGIEVHTPGVGNCLNLIHDHQLSNLRLISHDAIEVLQSMIPDESLDSVLLFFPDPWHKKRHHKRRIVNQQFRDLLVNKLKPDGVLHMATDWLDYADYMADEMLTDSRFTNLGNAQGFAEKPEYRPETKYERRGLKLGHGVWDLLFAKN